MIILVPQWAKNYDEFWHAVKKRNLWFIKLRYLFAALLFTFFLVGEFILKFELSLSQICAVLISVLIMLLYNVIFYKVRRYVKSEQGHFNCLHLSLLQTLADLALLLFLLYFTGTIDSPLYLFFLIQMIIASLILPGYIVYSIAAIFSCVFSAMIILQHSHLIPTHLISGLYNVEPAHSLSYMLLFILIFIFMTFITVYIANTITRRLYQREQLAREHLEALREAEIERQKFIMSVVHEIKSPIAAVQSLLDIILNNFVGPVSEQVEEKLSRARLRTDDALYRINTILKISKLKLLNKTTNEEIDISNVIKTVIDTDSVTAQSKSINMKFADKRTQKRKIIGDRTFMELAISNIVSNAIKYTDHNGIIRIEVSDDKENLRIEISDNGIGIPQKDRKNIFEQFYRGSNIKKSNVEGSGLGLSLVKEIVEKHSGTIEIISPSRIGDKKRPGTSVIIKLPYDLTKICGNTLKEMK